MPAVAGGHGVLRIADELSGLDQLAEVVFELTNMEGATELSELWTKAVASTVSRAEFAQGMTLIEYRAVGRFKVLARQFALAPGSRDRMLQNMLKTPDDPSAYRRWILDQGAYDPEVYWGRAYDGIARPTVRQ